ncbi:MAG: hypothetical protein LC657_03770, partial [Desulfobacteraceae bacterium]|nr:hypothetical protein [Desulfobacteraceae bacterium]
YHISNVDFSGMGKGIWSNRRIYECSGAEVESRINVRWYSYKKGTDLVNAGHEFGYLSTNSTPDPVLTIELIP